MRTSALVAITLFGVQVSTVWAFTYGGKLGVEASGNAFVDQVREHYRWEKASTNGAGWMPLTAEDVDKQGWPQTDCRWIMDLRPCAEWAGQIDDPDAYRPDHSGIYKGSFHGAATVEAIEWPFVLTNQVYDQSSHTTTFDLILFKPSPQHGLVILGFRDTRREPDSRLHTGLAQFRLIRPGYSPTTSQLFTREYLTCLRSAAFSTLRFMAVLDTNGNVEWGKDQTRVQHWECRKRPDDAAVCRMDPLNKKDGWPWEFAVQLCNEADLDMWINIPVSVDDNYIRQLAILLKTTLNPRHSIYIEYSNEIWNFGFLQYGWNKARAVEEVKAGQALYNYDRVGNEEIWAQRRHAQRLKDTIAIFADIFGSQAVNHRIRGVLAGVTPDPKGFFICGRLPGMLQYLNDTRNTPCHWIYAISIPVYYGGKMAAAEPGSEIATVDQILVDMRHSVEQKKAERLAVVELAQRYKLPGGFCAYEGGPDLGVGRMANLGNRIHAVRDPRQKDIYKMNLADGFWDLGGNIAMQFALAGRYTRYGAWGLTDDVNHPDRNSLFQAARELTGDGR